jgi:hypothetical protein
MNDIGLMRLGHLQTRAAFASAEVRRGVSGSTGNCPKKNRMRKEDASQ